MSKIELMPLALKKIELRLVGTTPLICHRWSVKAREMMAAKQQKKSIPKPGIRVPEAEFRDSLYVMPGGNAIEGPWGFKALAFKAAAVTACTSIGGVTKVAARQAFHIDGIGEEMLVAIEGRPQSREDMVRIGMGTADLRYRGEFTEWAVVLPITYNSGVISEAQIVNLFETAGFAVGVGEWRPETDGTYGRFKVDTRCGEAGLG